jgi:lysozyme family protein
MSAVKLTDALRVEYNQLFQSCRVDSQRASTVDDLAQKLNGNRNRYESTGEPLGIPWTFIAVTARTVQVPKGRPRTGTPPFTWEESARDALLLKKLDTWTDWTVAGTLYKLEEYNGWGYRRFHPDVKSPYLWSFSNHYRSGKYVADGTWSQTAKSQQCGAALLLRRMAELGHSGFSDQAVPALDAMPAIVRYSASEPSDPEVRAAAMALQDWLSTHKGIFVKPDGWPARRTSDAFKLVTGRYLPGDPRG